MTTAKEIIERYQLEPLDHEGGYFRQVWRSGSRIDNQDLGDAYPAGRDHPMGTLIHYLLTADSFSAMHRLPTAEHWLYHLGDPAEMLLLHPDGLGQLRILGPDLQAHQEIHLSVPPGSWQGTKPAPQKDGCGYCFCSCMMVPGFEWTDFELGDAATLCRDYPEHSQAISGRTRD
jgi:uncharacterized protein